MRLNRTGKMNMTGSAGSNSCPVMDVAGLVCLCHLLTSDSWPDCLRKLCPFAYPLERAGTHHHIPATPHFSCRTPAFSVYSPKTNLFILRLLSCGPTQNHATFVVA